MKTYVITLSKVFLKDHPKAGQLTNFRQSFEAGKKIHTIRGNADYWVKIIDEVNAGRAVLHIREWIDKPYRSKQETIAILDAKSGVGYQDIFITRKANILEASVDDKYIYVHQDNLYNNDALEYKDFKAWFFKQSQKETTFKGVVIHFTKFRY